MTVNSIERWDEEFRVHKNVEAKIQRGDERHARWTRLNTAQELDPDHLKTEDETQSELVWHNLADNSFSGDAIIGGIARRWKNGDTVTAQPVTLSKPTNPKFSSWFSEVLFGSESFNQEAYEYYSLLSLFAARALNHAKTLDKTIAVSEKFEGRAYDMFRGIDFVSAPQLSTAVDAQTGAVFMIRI